jgi:general stress protein YciG
MATETTNTKNRGFASMNSEKQREIARKGGRAAHEKGTAHEFTSDEARAAGRKGGERVSADRRHMAEIGRLGGRSSAGRRTSRPRDENAPESGGGEASGNGEEQNTGMAEAATGGNMAMESEENEA